MHKVQSPNPNNNPFVKKLLGISDTRDEKFRKDLLNRKIAPKTFVVEFSYFFLNLMNTLIAGKVLTIALTGYGWFLSLDATLDDVINYDKSHTLFTAERFNLEHASQLLLADCGLICVGALMSTLGIYQSSRRKIILSFIFLLSGISLEIWVIIASKEITERNCDMEPFKTRLGQLMETYFANTSRRTGTELRSVRNLNALQLRMKCCGIQGYKDYFAYANGSRMDLPFSCCAWYWVNNFHCSINVLWSGDEKLKDSRLHEEGCLQKVATVCERIYYGFYEIMIIVLIFRIIIVILQIILTRLTFRFYQEEIYELYFGHRPPEVKKEELVDFQLSEELSGIIETTVPDDTTIVPDDTTIVKTVKKPQQKLAVRNTKYDKAAKSNNFRSVSKVDKRTFSVRPSVKRPKVSITKRQILPSKAIKRDVKSPTPDIKKSSLPLEKKSMKKRPRSLELQHPRQVNDSSKRPSISVLLRGVKKELNSVLVKRQPAVKEPTRRPKPPSRKKPRLFQSTVSPAWAVEPPLKGVHEKDVASEFVGGTGGQRKIIVSPQISTESNSKRKEKPSTPSSITTLTSSKAGQI